MYIGYYSALSHHGLTEQVPRTVYVVTPTRAQSREIHGVPYRVTTVTGRKFFGTTPTSIEGTTIQVSDLRRPSSIVLTIRVLWRHPRARVRNARRRRTRLFLGNRRRVSRAPRQRRRDQAGSSTSPTSLASAFPPERGSSRRSRVAIPCWTPRVLRPGRQPARTGSASISSWTRWRRRSP